MSEQYDREILLNTPVSIQDYVVSVTELPLVTPFNLPFGAIDTRPSAWLRVSGSVNDDHKAYGAAEGTSLPLPIPLYDDCSTNLARNVGRILEGIKNSRLTLQGAHEAIGDVQLGGNYATARMTVETAMLDMTARSQATSVYELLVGEKLQEAIAVPYGKSIAETDYDKLVVAGIVAVGRGANRLKFKLSPITHRAVFRGIRRLQQLHPDASFMVDANGMFDPDNPEHRDILREADTLGLMMIEEPVSRAKGASLQGLDAHRRLQEVLPLQTPIALDDAVISREHAYAALNEGLGQIVNLKPGRLGSFIECLKIADLAKEMGCQVMVGGMLEATPGRTMTLTLAALCLRKGFTIPGDVSLPQERLTEDLVPESEQLQLGSNGSVIFRPQAGWGYNL